MKAAVLHQVGDVPKYEDFPEPVPSNEEQVLISVKASSIKQLDKLKASGKHYTQFSQMPTAVGVDGIGMLENGTYVYAQGITGMMAEKALTAKDKWTVLPPNIDVPAAAALPNALMGAAAALLYRAGMKKGDTVLINGATGVTGKIAVQIAGYYGAARIIATGRNQESLRQLRELGADDTVSLKGDDQTIIESLKKMQNETPVDIVIDYLWGHPVELIISAFNDSASPIKIVSVGEMAGANISLASGTLRSSGIQLLGSGIGSLSKERIAEYNADILPEMFQLAADGKLKIDVTTTKLEDVESAWTTESEAGKRIVLTM